MKSRIYVGIIILMLFFIPKALAVSIGTIPGVLDLGEVRRGQKVYAEFYITSTLTHPLKVNVDYFPPHSTIMQPNPKRSYKFNPAEASEEDIRDWVKIQDTSMVLYPDKYILLKLPSGKTIKYNQKLRFMIEIPEDAEPGYHAGALNIYVPKQQIEGGRGASIATLGITRPMFVFRVAGNAIRKIRIIGVEAKRRSNNEVRIDVLVKNEGTVTTSAYLENIHIYNDFGYDIAYEISRNLRKIKPGEIALISAWWRDKNGIKSGTYKVNLKAGYLTGSTEYSGEIKVTDIIEVSKEGKAIEKQKSGIEIPWWYLLIIMGLIALYIYWKM